MSSFRAFRIHDNSGAVAAGLEDVGLDELTAGEVVIHAHYSSVNYKDMLAATGKGKILRRFPLIGGVDVAGVVSASVDDRFKVGDAVLVTGCGLGESHDGGFSEVVRVPADWVVPLPAGLSLFDAMALGTAGFTAALAIDRLEQNSLLPGQGPVIVTGASGGVGSIAIDLLNGRGYDIVALSRKPEKRFSQRRSADPHGFGQLSFGDLFSRLEFTLDDGRFDGVCDILGKEFGLIDLDLETAHETAPKIKQSH